MKTSILAGLEGEEKKNVEGEYLSSPLLRKRLTELLLTKQRKAYEDRISKSSYDSPNWAALQADGIGYERAINEIIALLK